jgi:hypothetical protein
MMIGTVKSIKVHQNLASPVAWITFLANGATQTETLILWDTPDTNWIARSLNLSLLRDALVNKLQANVGTASSTSALITFVELLGP